MIERQKKQSVYGKKEKKKWQKWKATVFQTISPVSNPKDTKNINENCIKENFDLLGLFINRHLPYGCGLTIDKISTAVVTTNEKQTVCTQI